MPAPDKTTKQSVFVIVETPYDNYRIRTVCRTRREAMTLCKAHEDMTDFPIFIHEIDIGAPWLGLGYDGGYEEINDEA